MASMSPSCRSLLSLFCYLLCCYGVCRCISGTFYADNGRQQSVLYKTLGINDKSELEKEILRLLGLPHRQRPRRHDTNNSAPRYLLDLYKALEEEDEAEETKSREKKNIRKTLSDSDVVVSFVNKIPHHKSTNLRHETDRRFLFDVSDVPPEEEIVAAELRIYRDPELIKNKNLNGVYILDLYSLIDGDNVLEPVDELIISGHNTGWLAFNVTSAVMYWIAFPFRNNGLYLKIKAVGNSHSYNPHEIGLIGSKGPEDKQPFMVAYFKTPTKLHIRKPRAAKKRHHDSYYDQHSSWNPYSNTYPSRRSCRRWTLYISFRDLGWQEWIIAPDGYGAYYCHGECSFPLNAEMNATNHAIVQTLVHLMDPAVVPKPCCAPTHTHAITVLYFDDNSNVILKKYKNMVVKSCGCH